MKPRPARKEGKKKEEKKEKRRKTPHDRRRQLVLAANAPQLLSVWRYYQWKGSCDKRTFKRVLQEPLTRFVTQAFVKVIRQKLDQIVGLAGEEEESLTKSQILVEHPWVEQFVTEIGPLLEESISIELPEHFVNQVVASVYFRLY